MNPENTNNDNLPVKRRHLIKNGWIRIPLKTLMWLMLIVLSIPVLIYLPPVQTFVKDLACRMASESMGMRVEIGQFRLRFPLDVALDDVVIIEAGGDTMAAARKAIADVKLKPLLDKEIRLNALRLVKGYYKMVSEDSSMVMKLRAGLLDVDGRSSFALSSMNLDLNRARLRDGDVSLYMNVWKKKPTPPDSVTPPSPFCIKAGELKLENISFAMSMLPTIDTLTLRADRVNLNDAVIDLMKSDISARFLGLDKGAFSYITPTAEYIKAHPAPTDTITPPSPPMTIRADSVSLDNFDVLYAVKEARPQPGFDASYISMNDVNVSLTDFFNQASTLRAPITRLMAKERSGLQILSGTGIFSIDSIGLNLQDIAIATAAGRLSASASVPFALMEMKPDAPLSVKLQGDIGFADINRFMPALSRYTSQLAPARKVTLDADAAGTLSSLHIARLDVDLPSVLSLRAKGKVDNPLKPERLRGDLTFRASLTAPQVAQKMSGMKDVNIPSFEIDGNASIDRDTYRADFVMQSSAGDVTADGYVALTPENYRADVAIQDLNVADIMPAAGVGVVTASLTAEGAGFNPSRPGTFTDVNLDVTRADYSGHSYTGITGTVGLHKGVFDIDLNSSDPDANLYVTGSGSISDGQYTADIHADVSNLDLKALNLSETENNGSFDVYINGTADPARWLYDMEMTVNNLDWRLPDQNVTLPAGVTASLLATDSDVAATFYTDGMTFDFATDTSLQALVDNFTAAATAVGTQIGNKNLDMTELQKHLPSFNMHLNANGRGVLAQLLQPQGFSVDSIYADISNADSTLNGNISILRGASQSLTIDTVNLRLHQRDTRMDYALHVGNTVKNMPEFASVDLSGYLGGNRVSAFLRQRNRLGETGYRLGLTAAMMDSTVTVHFTPLKATIAYMPWTLNVDNHIDLNMRTRRIDANLSAQSLESSILVKTQPNDEGDNTLRLNLTNIHVQDFLQMAVTAPPLQATISADVTLMYKGAAFYGDGRVDVSQFKYDHQPINDFSLGFDADLDLHGNTKARASLIVAENEVMTLDGTIQTDDAAKANDFTLRLTGFPLSFANPFIGKDMAQLEGSLNGEMRMDGDFTAPVLNGSLQFDNAAVLIPMMGSKLHFNPEPIRMTDNIVVFDNFGITGQNENPLTVNGNVNMKDLTDVSMNLALKASDFQLLNNDKRARSELYGKMFLDMGAQVSGSLSRLDINGNLTVLNSTDVTYSMSAATGSLNQATQSDVVKFVNLSDTTSTVKTDSTATAMSMRIRAALTINPGTKVTVGLPPLGSANKVQLSPSGTLNYYQNYMGDMRLNGQLLLGKGMARYALPVVGEKLFTLESDSYVQWNGPVLNPILNIRAYDEMKVNVSDRGNSRLVNFLVDLAVTNSLDAPKVTFDLSAEGDMTIQNELQSMTPDQRSNQAMNLLLYGQYSGPNTKTVSGNLAESALYSFLTSTLNSWAANNIRGVDISFGVNRYDRTSNGENSHTTSYSYQVSKSLFNNRFKIVVGGNYTTDASADENFAQNLLSDVSFEYMLKQTNSLSMLVKLFRHSDYESILEGEVTETGVGFVMKRRMENLRHFFRVRWGKRKTPPSATDSVATGSAVTDTVQIPQK